MRHNHHIDLTPAHALHQAETYRCNVRLPSPQELCKQAEERAMDLFIGLIIIGILATACLMTVANGLWWKP